MLTHAWTTSRGKQTNYLTPLACFCLVSSFQVTLIDRIGNRDHLLYKSLACIFRSFSSPLLGAVGSSKGQEIASHLPRLSFKRPSSH